MQIEFSFHGEMIVIHLLGGSAVHDRMAIAYSPEEAAQKVSEWIREDLPFFVAHAWNREETLVINVPHS